MSYRAEPWLRDLTSFQRRSVDHVIEQFYGPAEASRFLVADETGLGKTRVAQGVIAKAIEELQQHDHVQRIDVVYVCANADLAKQNIRRLNVTGQGEIPFSSRLTLLGEHSRRLQRGSGDGKGINLVSFTPGTSFDMGHSLGQARERAMIVLALLELLDLNGYERTALHVLLQGQVGSLKRFRDDIVHWLRRDIGDEGIDPSILEQFNSLLDQGGEHDLRTRLHDALATINRKTYIPLDAREDALRVVRDLRAALAAASVETLEPDLVILDEFQRFRHLLSSDNAAGELAHHLFGYAGTKVLLLSATPYKPFTLAEEGDEEHARDLFRTLDFLAQGRADADVDGIRRDLREYRRALESNTDPRETVASLRRELLKLMSRNERPHSSSMTVEKVTPADDLRATDLTDFALLTKIADAVRHPRDRGLVTPEYWKSAPYFLTFCEGYQLGRRLKDAEATDELRALVRASNHIRPGELESFAPVEPGNARMRVLAGDTVDRGWWKLLWMPPSLPYFQPSGPYASDTAANITKRVVFSSWTATPSSVASILSYEAERRATEHSTTYTTYSPEARRRISRRLQYAADPEGRPRQMAVLMCHWPMAGLARHLDPLTWAAEQGGRLLRRDEAVEHAKQVLSARLGDANGAPSPDDGHSEAQDRHWRAAFSWPDSWPDTEMAVIISALSSQRATDELDESDGSVGLIAHIDAAASARAETPVRPDAETLTVLAEVGLFSPANVAYRALARLQRSSSQVTGGGLFAAAATLANGLRSLFNRPDVIQLIDNIGEEDLPYWRKMLTYIAMGNLEAVLDEYLHQLFADRTTGEANDALLAEIAHEAAEALSLRSPNLRGLVPDEPETAMPFVARFALRYGGREQDAEDARQPEVRRAFNSPFWPFVLASTSVGQEGIDFHWWCHAVFHWNTPSNPVDFEQREGRVDRYRGHAVRKNIAAAHGNSVLSEGSGHPWDRLYELATDRRDEFGDFSPGWVYPGPHKIERHIAPFAFSTDLDRYKRVKRDVALYRLTFGQPRQEDLLEVLRTQSSGSGDATVNAYRIDLAPGDR